MENIKIIGNGLYLPTLKVESSELEKKFNVEEGYILKRTGINTRYYKKDENICEMAYKASKNAIETSKIDVKDIDLIIVATTSTNTLMPGISYYIQGKLNIEKCICLDILAGCAGYVNAFDIAYNYIAIGKVRNALIIGVDKLSTVIEKKDMATAILFGDGAGATIISKAEEQKNYYSNIKSNGMESDLLTYRIGDKLKMDGTNIYKYAVTEVPKLINETLKISGIELNNIKHIILHQSNIRIMNSIAKKLKISNEKICSNIDEVGNTFCASIPILLSEININPGENILMCGYGGGLNTGCIIMEV